jgi:hypothetical protein
MYWHECKKDHFTTTKSSQTYNCFELGISYGDQDKNKVGRSYNGKVAKFPQIILYQATPISFLLIGDVMNP